MIIEKERFVEMMNQLKDTSDLQDKFYDLTNEYCSHSFYDDTEIMFPTLADSLIDALECMFDEENTQTISWWCYDEDFGRDFHKYDFGYTINSKQYYLDLSTPENLYDFLLYQKNDEYENMTSLVIKEEKEDTK